MSPAPKFCLGWEAGSSAQIEVFSPNPGADEGVYGLKYTAPFRATLRPPIGELSLTEHDLNPIRGGLNQLVATPNARGAGARDPETNEPQVLKNAKRVGEQLMGLMLPRDVQVELREPGRFLEIGLDERLLEFPWELMFDGDDFLCLKHHVGRFVNTSRPAIPSFERQSHLIPAELSVLLISVPQPQPRDNGKLLYEYLPEAAAETQAIVDVLTDHGVQPQLLAGPRADWNGVVRAAKAGKYHVVHFSGHAVSDPTNPRKSSLVLFDQDMTPGHIKSYFGSSPPVLFFMNACETAAPATAGWKQRYDIFGLARAFLETSSYLIGTRWKVGDTGAAAFAKAFYSTLLGGRSLGYGIREGRMACRTSSSADDLSWASYLFYGDPRVCFQRAQTEGT